MLEKLFTSKNRINVLEFFFFQKSKSHLREIARELNISSSAVKREIDNLTKINILKKGNTSISLNSACPFLNDLKNIFLKTDSISYPIKESLKKIKAEFIIIFGSFAKNSYKNESDIDLLIIGEINQEKAYKILAPIETKIKKEINPVIWTKKDLQNNKNKGFLKDILKKEKIFLRGEESEFRKLVEH